MLISTIDRAAAADEYEAQNPSREPPLKCKNDIQNLQLGVRDA